MNQFMAVANLSGNIFVPAGAGPIGQNDLMAAGFDVRGLLAKKAIVPAGEFNPSALPPEKAAANVGGGLEDIQARVNATVQRKPSQTTGGEKDDWKAFITTELNRIRDETVFAVCQKCAMHPSLMPEIPPTVGGIVATAEPEVVPIPVPIEGQKATPGNPYNMPGPRSPMAGDPVAAAAELAANDGLGKFT